MKLFVDHHRCTGCHICSFACSFTKEKVMNRLKGRIHINQPSMDVTEISSCTQCGDCIEACPENALDFDPRTGAVLLNDENCTGCGFCFDACESGYLRGHPQSGHPLLCDLCSGNPICVSYCPREAIRTEREGGDKSSD